jgi:hypothetical protein
MTGRIALRVFFSLIIVVMLAVTTQATLHQAIWDWGGLTQEPDRWWTLATLVDAYCGFLTFFAWVYYKETRAAARVTWFILIMTLGNLAMATYCLLQLARLRPEDPLESLLLRAHRPLRPS